MTSRPAWLRGGKVATDNRADKPDWFLNAICATVAWSQAFIGLGAGLAIGLWGGLIVAVFAKSRRTRWAALTTAIASFATIAYFYTFVFEKLDAVSR